MNELTQKYRRPTLKECGHTEIWLGSEYLGYIMPNRSLFRANGENWNFVSKNFDFECDRAPNRNSMIALIRIQCDERRTI